MTTQEAEALEKLSIALEREIKAAFGDTREGIQLWLHIRDLSELSDYGRACRASGRALEALAGDEKYNGWTNRETWALKLHLDNTEGSQAWMLEVGRLAGENAEATEYRTLDDAKVFTTEDAIKDACETVWERALSPVKTGYRQFDISGIGEPVGMWEPDDVFRMIADVGSLWRVNFREIARSVVDQVSE